MLIRRVVVICPARATAACRVVVRSRHARRLEFAIPTGRRSRIRLTLRSPGRPPRRIKGRVSARAAGGGRVRRSFRVRVRERPGRWRSREQSGAAPRSRSAPQPANGAPSPPLIGLSDQEPATFADPRFASFPVATARLIVPWDAQLVEPAPLAAWLAGALAAGIEPLVALGHSRGDRCPGAPCRLPPVDAYRRAVEALLAAHPWLRLITPWNEPNHRSQPTAGAPGRAGAYYNAARAACPSCTLVAGDVLDAPGFLRWLEHYRGALGESPAVWGLHNYYDTTYGRSTGLDALLAAVTGSVWLTETGGIVSHRLEDGRVNLPFDTRRAATAVRDVIAMADERAGRVRRVYLYQWRAGAGADFDAGLLAADGSPRPAFRVVQSALAARTPAPAGTTPFTTGDVRLGLSGRVTLAGRTITVPLACFRAAGEVCDGRLHVHSARWYTATLVNGHPRGHLVPPRDLPLAVPAGGARVRIHLDRRPAERRRLRLRASITEPSGRSSRVVPVLRLR